MIKRTTLSMTALAACVLLVIGIFLTNFFAKHGAIGARKQKYRIAVLTPSNEAGFHELISGITETLEKEALFEPEIRIFDSNNNRLNMRANIETAIDEGYDLLAPVATEPTQMTKEMVAKRDTKQPIVFCGTGDPVASGIVDQMEHHSEDIAGYCIAGFDWAPDMFGMIGVIAPHVKRILIPYNPTSYGGMLEEYKEQVATLLREYGYQVSEVKIYEVNDVSSKLQAFIKKDIDMVLILPDMTMRDSMDVIAKLCEQYKVFSYFTMNYDQITKGAALAFGYNVYDMGVEAARYMRQVLEDGVRPKDLPVRSMPRDTYKVGMNLETARKQGLLDQMDERLVYLMGHSEVIPR